MVSLAEDGTIVGIDTWRELDREAGVEFHAGLLLPGLVNVHCHLELSCLRGTIAPGCGLAAFVRELERLRPRLGSEACARAVAAADARMWHDGVSAVGDVAATEYAFETKTRSPILYRTFAEFGGLQRDPAALHDCVTSHPEVMSAPCIYISRTLPDALLRSLCRTGEAPLMIHFLDPTEEVISSDPEAGLGRPASRDDQKPVPYDVSAVERLIACVPRDRRVILVVHNCLVTQEVIDRVMDHFTVPVWWSLCPGSDRYLFRRRTPVELLRRNGLNICIGTDSLAANDSMSLLNELRLLGEEVPLAERLRWITSCGAAALGIGESMGSLEPGRRPGLVLLRGFDPVAMRLLPGSETIRLV